MNSATISVLSLLASSIIIIWFTIMAVIKTGKKWPFLPFFIHFSLASFIAAGIFTGTDLSGFDIFIYIFSMIIGITYLIFIVRENK